MALYNYLYARKFGGKWILRIEDTDMVRSNLVLAIHEKLTACYDRLALSQDQWMVSEKL